MKNIKEIEYYTLIDTSHLEHAKLTKFINCREVMSSKVLFIPFYKPITRLFACNSINSNINKCDKT